MVTGMGIMSAIGCSVREYWSNLAAGTNGVRRITLFDTGDYSTDFAAEVNIAPEQASNFPSPKMMRRHDRHIVHGYLAGHQAFRDAGIDTDAHPERHSSLIGAGAGGAETFNYSGYDSIHKGLDAVHPLTVVNCIPSSGSGYFAQTHNLQGPNFAITAACATSNYTISIGAALIRAGYIDTAFVGGAEAAICPLGLSAFGNVYTLSRRKDSPETASRPFDSGRDGFVLGEGAGVLCIERLKTAKQRKARIYCEISGIGWSCDAHDFVAPDPSGQGAARAMDMALRDAHVSPDDVDLINTHATSTPLGDVAEYIAVQRVFKHRATSVMAHSTKSMIGHSLAASGGMEAIAAIMAIEEGVIHPTINQFEQDPQINFNVVKGDARQEKVTHVLSNGFGFGGLNAAVVFSRYDG